MADETYRNFFVINSEQHIPYTSKQQGGSKRKIPEVDRIQHGQKIQNKLQEAWHQAKSIDDQRTAVSLPTKKGVYLEFESAPNFELATKSLENHRQGEGIRLLNVRTETVDRNTVSKATVFIPSGKESFYLKKVQAYLEKESPKSHNPQNQALVAPMNNIRLAVLEFFWHGSKEWMPKDLPEWCEIWLSRDSDEAEAEVRNLLAALQVPMQRETLKFPERRVILGKVNRHVLQELIASSPYIAEFRRASETAIFFVELENVEQTNWAKDLLSRIKVDNTTDVCICILDTGVNNGHILIKPILDDKDCQSYDEAWGVHDHEGHGTRMSGIAGFGDLQSVLESSMDIKILHRLESFKIIPQKGENYTKLYGAITAQAVSSLTIKVS